MTTMNEREREAVGAFRRSLELAIEHATSDHVRLTIPTERARLLLDLLTPDDADVEEADRDELWAALQRVALNLCDCDARDGDECPPESVLHREHCNYALAHRPYVKQGINPALMWDDNFSLAVPPSSDWWPADVEPLEAKARILAGYDNGDADPFSAAERVEIVSWANAELGYPADEAPDGDSELARWYLGALTAFAQDKGLL